MATGPRVITEYAPETEVEWPRDRWADRTPRPVYVTEPAPIIVTPAPVITPGQGFQLTGTQLAVGAIILILLLKK